MIMFIKFSYGNAVSWWLDAQKKLANVSPESPVYTFPMDIFIYPVHDYKGFTVSTVGEERFGFRVTKDQETFKSIMESLAVISKEDKCGGASEYGMWVARCGVKSGMILVI
ncbi:hypothetical protein Tco_0351291 [Tanacetum coccineum]